MVGVDRGDELQVVGRCDRAPDLLTHPPGGPQDADPDHA
jgi:hypothetical protein